MQRSGKCKWYLHIYGDWPDVIRLSRENEGYYEQLLGQKPDCVEDLEDCSHRYDIEVTGLDDLVKVYEMYRGSSCRCFMAMGFVSEDKMFNVHADSGNGFQREPESICIARAQSPLSEIEEAARKAMIILQEAVK